MVASSDNPARNKRLADEASEFFVEFNACTDFDRVLAPFDLELSRAHVSMLAQQQIITSSEADQIIDGLDAVESDIGQPDFQWQKELEDVHMNIESLLRTHIGDLAGKMHTARSRNDQVATAFRMYINDALQKLQLQLIELRRQLCIKAQQHASVVMPGFTHLQAAQPVSFGHHLLAWAEMLKRDSLRLEQAAATVMSHCPLGAAALAGTTFNIDPSHTAKSLGFSQPVANSLDAVSDRDFALETASALSIMMMHLSRQAEEIINWSSTAWQLIDLPAELCAGSSIMPQKRNPDLAELVRGKSGRVVGSLNSLLLMMKGLPLAYNKDTQEDKEPLIDALTTASHCLTAWTALIEGVKPNIDAMRTMAGKGHAVATDLADRLVVERGLPFREAYAIVGELVAAADANNVELSELPEVASELIQKVSNRCVLGRTAHPPECHRKPESSRWNSSATSVASVRTRIGRVILSEVSGLKLL